MRGEFKQLEFPWANGVTPSKVLDPPRSGPAIRVSGDSVEESIFDPSEGKNLFELPRSGWRLSKEGDIVFCAEGSDSQREADPSLTVPFASFWEALLTRGVKIQLEKDLVTSLKSLKGIEPAADLPSEWVVDLSTELSELRQAFLVLRQILGFPELNKSISILDISRFLGQMYDYLDKEIIFSISDKGLRFRIQFSHRSASWHFQINGQITEQGPVLCFRFKNNTIDRGWYYIEEPARGVEDAGVVLVEVACG